MTPNSRRKPQPDSAKSGRRLRKQRKVKREEAPFSYSMSSLPMPPLSMPETAQRRRRRRETTGLRSFAGIVRTIALSSRWLSGIVLVLAAYALFLIATNPRFYITRIPVDGAIAYSPEEIAEVSALGGKHVFAVDLSQSAEQISSLAGIVSANVELRWPDKVRIVVEEQPPILLWEEAGLQFWVTENGGLLAAGRKAIELPRIRAEVPIVAADTILSLTELAQQPLDDAKEDKAQTYLSYIPEELIVGAEQLMAIRPNTDVIYYSPNGGLSVDDEGGWRVYYGTGADMVQKESVYQGIMAYLGDLDVTPNYVSVSNLLRPYYYAPALAATTDGE